METESAVICGHESARTILDHIAEKIDTRPQSFLFSGPRHLGKSLVAREFALKLIGTPALSNGFHPDCFFLGEEDEKDVISVDQIKEIQSFLSRFPEQGRYRVVVIDGADRLTSSAENALLKILEEPNSSSIIILIAHRPGQLLLTVRSRLFPITFHPVSGEQMRQFFPEAAELPDFFFSLGLPGLIRSAIVSPESFTDMKEVLKPLFQLTRLTWAERIVLAERLASDAEKLEDVLNIWLIGLTRRKTGEIMKTKNEAIFLELVLDTVDHIARGQGNPRLLMEKLFTAA